ncbi:MAG: hypothetical protein IAF38_02020 [Bacteroidia bacterium]|nr:hypothetical protein [Bacteroidia bacterium]
MPKFAFRNLICWIGLLVFCSFILQNNERLIWSKSKPPQWEDFMGQPDAHSDFKAYTSFYISWKTEIKDDTLIVSMNNFFEKNLSWVKEDRRKELLLHEQFHFNISEVYTRIMRKNISELKLKREDIQSSIDKEFKHQHFLLGGYTIKYDKETKHGLLPEKQKEWETKIAAQLDEYKDFSDTLVKIIMIDK